MLSSNNGHMPSYNATKIDGILINHSSDKTTAHEIHPHIYTYINLYIHMHRHI